MSSIGGGGVESIAANGLMVATVEDTKQAGRDKTPFSDIYTCLTVTLTQADVDTSRRRRRLDDAGTNPLAPYVAATVPKDRSLVYW